jgi:hypothetical protein
LVSSLNVDHLIKEITKGEGTYTPMIKSGFVFPWTGS